MKTYADIRTEITKLERQAEAALKQERAGVISRIKEAIEVYGLTAQDLGLGRAVKSKAKRRVASKATSTTTTVGVAKYRDPATGKTWTGRGKPPNWIKGVKDREPFLIGAGSSSGAPAAASKRESAEGQRRGGRRRKAAKKASRSARQTGIAPAVQIESGAATA